MWYVFGSHADCFIACKCANHERCRSGSGSCSSGSRLECDSVHARDLTEEVLEVCYELVCTLDCVCRLERMQFGKARKVCHLFVYSRIVLHRAGAERIESVVNSVRSLGKCRVVPAHLVLRDLRKVYFGFAKHFFFRKFFRYVAGREDILSSALNALFEYQLHIRTPPLRQL